MTTSEGIRLRTDDAVELEGELAGPVGAALARVVLCHPHPQFGGTMRSIVISALFEALPAAGIACLRFNFRGVEGSGGAWAEGREEPADVRAAVEAMSAVPAAGPLACVGWSFGADMALSVADERLAGWIAIAPPLHWGDQASAAAADPRPKHLVLAQHDEFRAPDGIVEAVAGWRNTTTEVIGGASHFFVGRTDRVVEVVLARVRELAH